MNDTTLDRYFSGRRFLALLRWELFMNYRALIVVLATTLGIAFAVNVFSVAAAPHFRIHEIFYSLLPLMAGGLIFSSLAFKDAHKPGSGLRYLTLPASRLEKTLAKFVLTAVGWVLASLAAYFLMSVLASLVTFLVAGKSHGLFNPLAGPIPRLIGLYLVVQSIFVFGSLFYRRAALAKTILSLIAFGFGLALVSGILFALTHIDLIARGVFLEWREYGGPFEPEAFFGFWKEIPGLVFYALTAPFMWLLTSVRLKEQEVRSL